MLALSESNGIIDQLHEEYKINLICTYTHVKFLQDFSRIFDLRMISQYQHSKYTWENHQYREFMTDIIFGLEPIRFMRNDMIM